MTTTIVTTTIKVPTFLKGYQFNAEKYGHDVNYIVAGDLKSAPVANQEFCDSIPNCKFLSSRDQYDYLERFPELRRKLPDNSPGRRNVALMMAYEQGADVVITLDDDNLATDYNAIGDHSIVGQTSFQPLHASSTGWLNVCNMLHERDGHQFYHRGYPPSQRWKDGMSKYYFAKKKVVVNAGLWTGNPDVDAVTRLEHELHVAGFRPDGAKRIALDPGTWSPFNCQNTALAREVIPAYFLAPTIGRHDDIFAGYIINRIAEHFGDVITFGAPLAFHDRSPHNLWSDLDAERQGMLLTDSFVAELRSLELTAKTYHEAYSQIIDGLWDWAESNGVYPMISGMYSWHRAFRELV